MAKSSIFKPFVVEGEENVRQFMNALKESAEFLKKHPIEKYENFLITDKKEIDEFIKKIDRNLEIEKQNNQK